MSDQLVLGYDFGTSAVKAALFNRDGTLLGHSSETYPLILPEQGWAEQRPEDWWQSMIKATQSLLLQTKVESSSICAIGICAQMCGMVPVNKQGVALHNALIWLDARSAPIALKITSGIIKVSGYGISKLLRWLWLTNGAPNLAGKDPISKMLWIKEQRNEIWGETHKLLDVKDYLIYRLSEKFVTTQDCGHTTWLMDTRPKKRCWSSSLAASVGIDSEKLPALAYGIDVVGQLTKLASDELGLRPNIPIVGGAGDVGAYAIGSGQVKDGAVHIHCGTGGWIAAHLNRRAVDIFTSVGTVCAPEPGRYLLIAVQETAGASVDWAVKNLAVLDDGKPDYAAFDDLAIQSPAGASGLFFFPWMFGERVPVDDDKIRGGFLNMSLEHGRPDLARAVLEGVALNTRWALGPVEKITGSKGNIRLMGGGAVSDLWCQIFADVLQRPIEQVFQPEFGGCRGAAMTAAVGAGWFENLEAATIMVKVKKTFEPDKNLAELYDEKFGAFVKNYQSIHGWYKTVGTKKYD